MGRAFRLVECMISLLVARRSGESKPDAIHGIRWLTREIFWFRQWFLDQNGFLTKHSKPSDERRTSSDEKYLDN
jgi:hypothetical protein